MSATPNTIKTNSVQKTLFLVSQGEIAGFPNVSSPEDVLKNVYFGNTPVRNTDGSYNINGVEVAFRPGTDDQTKIDGFPLASTAYNLGVKVTTTTPYTYTTTTGSVDSIRVTVRIPALFEQKDNGNVEATSVNFRFLTRAGSDSFVQMRTVTITEKSSGTFDLDFLIPRPSGTSGTWSVRMERITADNTSLSLANDTYFQIATEIQNVSLAYPKNALVAIKTTSENTGQQPLISFDIKGLLVKVPSNYTVSTRTYTGVWDGTFKTTKEWCDNPVWCLYDLLTNADHGLGEIIAEEDIDQYSFYDAAQYCDELVPALDSDGEISGTEPRFTFNYQYTDNNNTFAVLQNIAATFNAVVFSNGTMIKLFQERPTDYSRIISNSNVIDGFFDYQSGTLDNRYTAAIVYWNNPEENMLSVPAYYEDTAALTAGEQYNLIEKTAIGCTSYGQAMRAAKTIVERSLSTMDTVSFKVGFSNAGIEVGEVVAVMDSNYAQIEQEAIVVSSTATTVTVDRPITVQSSWTFDVVKGDATGLETRNISSNTSGTTINYSGGAITALPGSPLIVSGTISPRLFRITSVEEDSDNLGTYNVTGTFYDQNLYARIDNTPEGPTRVYQTQPAGYVVSMPSALTFTEESILNADGNPIRYVVASWSPAAGQRVDRYRVYVRINGGDMVDLGYTSSPFIKVPVDVSSTITFYVYALNSLGKQSLPRVGTYTVDLDTPVDLSDLLDVTSLVVKGGGTTFTSPTCVVTWTNPNVNNEGPVQKGYEIQVRSSDGATLYRLELLGPNITEYSYDLVKQEIDNPGSPKRTFRILVKVIDTFNRRTAGTSITVNNPAPAAPTLSVSTGVLESNVLQWNKATDSDLQGYIVWGSQTNGFTPSTSNKIADLDSNFFTHTGLADGSTWYYKVGAYDTFGKSDTGSGMNLSSQQSGVTGIGDSTVEYMFTGGTWQANNPSTNQVSWTSGTVMQTLGDDAGDTWSISASNATWTSGILYIYWIPGSTSFSSSTSLPTVISANGRIMATYRGGLNLEVSNGKAYLDGGLLYAQTVGANTMVANLFQSDNVLTRGLAVRDYSGNVILSAGTPLAATYITPSSGWLNTNITVNANGTLTGAGGGQITIAGLDNSVLRSGNPITSGNISTYIASAAIGGAYIQDAAISSAKIGDLQVGAAKILDGAITNAKIGNLAVDSLKIAGNAATSLVWASGTSSTINTPTFTVTANDQYVEVLITAIQTSQTTGVYANQIATLSVGVNGGSSFSSLQPAVLNVVDDWSYGGGTARYIIPGISVCGPLGFTPGNYYITCNGSSGVYKVLMCMIRKR